MGDRASNWNPNRRPGRFGRGSRGNRGRGRGDSWRGGHKSYRGSSFGINYGSFQQKGAFGDGRPRNYGSNSRGGGGAPWHKMPKKNTPGKRLSEEEIGVTEYIADHSGFQGIIKSRYSDFQVSEINEQGEVAQLTDLSPPQPPADEPVDEDEDLLISKYNLEILPMETWDKINLLAMLDPNAERVEIDVTGMTKEQRTKIHDAVKKAFGDSIVGSTVTEGEKKLVVFDKYRKGVRVDNRVKWIWPGEYVYFIVHKENCDTMDAASRIAERLRLNIKPSMLGYAGTKDRRAKTSQWFSLRKVDPRRIATSCAGIRDVLVGNYSFSSRNLKLGMLKGNKFRIALRNVTSDEGVVDTACGALRTRGFLNYYGLQRFGTRPATPTYRVGLELLQGNFKEAISSILEEREGPLQEALRAYKREGAVAALWRWPRGAPHAVELRLLTALAHCPNDLLGALSKLARNTRLLYLHSYQSVIWNRAVSERVRKYGLTAVPGDLVPLTQLEEEELPEEESDTEESDDADGTNAKGQSENENGDDGDALRSGRERDRQKGAVKVLTEEDIASGKYSIKDIVLPLPGHTVQYPPNMVQFYEDQLAKDGLKLDMKHKIKSYSLCGAYRRVVGVPVSAEWSWARYSDPCADLILSDRDLLEGKTLDGVVEDGKYKALILTITLPASCYATMALRELLRVDTSGDNQALQNNYHMETEDTKKEPEGTEERTKKVEERKVEQEGADCKKQESDKQENVPLEAMSVEVSELKSEGEKRKLEDHEEGTELKKLKQQIQKIKQELDQ